MSFTPVQKVSAYEVIVRQVEAALADGELKVGDRLPGERKLMEDFSVSRATVREALRVLQATGVVESRPGDPRGPVIAAYSPRLLEKSMSQLARLEGNSRTELIQFRLFLEGSATFLAASLHTPEQLQSIESTLSALVDGVADAGPLHFEALVSEFHASIRRASGNELFTICGHVVSGVMADLMDRRLAREENPRALVRRSAEDGVVLVEAIRRRDAVQARALQMSNIYRFYAADLTPEERSTLDGMVTDGYRPPRDAR